MHDEAGVALLLIPLEACEDWVLELIVGLDGQHQHTIRQWGHHMDVTMFKMDNQAIVAPFEIVVMNEIRRAIRERFTFFLNCL